jgi:type III secretory pathway component EscT
VTTSAALALATARMAPLGWVALPLGGPSRSARAIVAALLVALVLPSLLARPAPQPLATVLVTELLVGLFLGLVGALPVYAARAAGGLLDAAIQPGRSTRSFGDGYELLALALFAALDGPRLVIVAATESYAALPLGHGLASPQLPQLLAVGARLVAAAVTLAAPALAALLVADVALALVARPQPLVARVIMAAPLRLLVIVLAVAAAALTTMHTLLHGFTDAASLKLPP